MMETQQQERALVFDTTQHYACTDCRARCCRNPWKIALSPQEAQTLKAMPWVVERLADAKTDFVADGDFYKLPRVPKADGGLGCVFLDEDDLCAIQKREGHQTIPRTCQDYPFSFIADRTDGQTLYTATSFFCKSILYDYGVPLADFIEDKSRRWQEHHTIPALPDSLPLGGLNLSKAAYLALAEQLTALFERDDLSIAQALLGGRDLLWAIITGHAGQPEIQREAMLDTVQEFLSLHGRPGLPKPAPGALIGRAMLAMEMMVLASEPLLLRHQAAGKAESGFKFTYLGQVLRLISGKGTLPLWDFPKPVQLQAAGAVRIDENDAAVQSLLKRYYRHLFENKHLFCQKTDLLKLYFRLGSGYPLILRLARYHANAHDRKTAVLEDYTEAVGYADVLLSSKGRTGDDAFARIREVITDILATRPDSFERLLLSESSPV